jgi:hypothetical protein
MQKDKLTNFDYIVDKTEERLLPSGAKKINLKSKILDFISQKLGCEI